MGLAGDWSVEVNQASPITTSSPEILTRNGLVPPFQCHHRSSSPRRGVSLQNTTPQGQQQQKTRTTTRFPLLFLPVKAKKKRKERGRESDQETNQTHHPKTKPKSSSGRNCPRLYTSLGCGEDGSSFCGECHVGGREGGVRSDSSLVFCELQLPAVCLILRFSSAAPPRE